MDKFLNVFILTKVSIYVNESTVSTSQPLKGNTYEFLSFQIKYFYISFKNSEKKSKSLVTHSIYTEFKPFKETHYLTFS